MELTLEDIDKSGELLLHHAATPIFVAEMHGKLLDKLLPKLISYYRRLPADQRLVTDDFVERYTVLVTRCLQLANDRMLLEQFSQRFNHASDVVEKQGLLADVQNTLKRRWGIVVQVLLDEKSIVEATANGIEAMYQEGGDITASELKMIKNLPATMQGVGIKMSKIIDSF